MKVYILKLIGGKYYIGSSENVEQRIQQHFDGNGSAWTKKYKPIKKVDVIDNCDKFDEDKYTKQYMSKYGIDNVRGGTYCEINIEKYKEFLEKELTHSDNKCFKCGGTGHYVKDCKETEEESGHWKSLFENFQKVLEKELIHSDNKHGCAKHYTKDCEETEEESEEEVWECDYCDEQFETEKEAKKHEKYSHKDVCYRCGREGHYSNSCYAKRHINGNYI